MIRLKKKLQKKDIIILSVIIAMLVATTLYFISKRKKYMQDAEIVYESNRCWVTVINNGEVLKLSDKQINKLMYLMEHSYAKTFEKGGFRDDINEDASLYIDIQYENEICISNDDANSFYFYRILYTYEDKYNNKLTYHIKNDIIGYRYYNMPYSDMNELESILNLSFLD